MKQNQIQQTFLAIVFMCWLLPVAATQPINIFVSVLPQKTFVEKIGGQHVNVEAMVKPGHNPATYNPTPRQIARLAQAQLYIYIGMPFESVWMKRIQAVNPKMILLNAQQGLNVRQMHGHDGHDHTTKDPHIWTNPLYVKIMAQQIRDQLITLQPKQQPLFEKNYAEFSQMLTLLDRDIRQQLAPLRSRRFMVFHPSWGYFADAYQLTQIAIEKEGKTPSAKTLHRLINQARLEQVKAIFVQPQFNQKAARQIAHAIKGKVVVIDPLAPNYIENLRKVSQMLIQADQ